MAYSFTTNQRSMPMASQQGPQVTVGKHGPEALSIKFCRLTDKKMHPPPPAICSILKINGFPGTVPT